MQTIELALLCAIFFAMVLIAFPNTVKKYRIILYSAMIIVEAYFVGPAYFDYSLAFGLSEGRNALRSFFCMGIMAEALFAVVAYVGVMPSKWDLTKRLKSVRAELSVLGCIISFGEIFYYANYFIMFFNGELSTGRNIATIATILLFVLMVPLMLTSLYFVRRHMKPKNWQRLQYFSYLFYFGLLLHIIGLYGNFDGGISDFLTGRHADALRCYLWIWVSYFVLRIAKYLFQWLHPAKKVERDMMIEDEDADRGPAYCNAGGT